MTTDTPQRPPLWNLANQLTLSRLLLSGVLFAFIEYELWLACLILFIVAAITDWLDGYVARKYNLGTPLGRILDPLVDKVIICGSFVFLLTKPDTGLAAWMVVTVIGREFLITGLRGYLEQQGTAFGADIWGKFKMVLQCAALVVIFLVPICRNWATDDTLIDSAVVLRDAIIWLMVAITIYSGWNYCLRARGSLR